MKRFIATTCQHCMTRMFDSAWRAKTTRLGTLFAVTFPNNCILFSCCIVSKDFLGKVEVLGPDPPVLVNQVLVLWC